MFIYEGTTFDGKLAHSICGTPVPITGDPISNTQVKRIGTQNPGEWYVVIRNINPYQLGIDAQSQPLSANHGTLKSPNYRRDRTITVEGYVVGADKLGVETGIRALQNLYKTSVIPGNNDKGFYELKWTSNDGQKLVANCQVINQKPSVTKEVGQHYIYQYSLELRTETTAVFYDTEQLITVQEGTVGGFLLNQNHLGESFDAASGSSRLLETDAGGDAIIIPTITIKKNPTFTGTGLIGRNPVLISASSGEQMKVNVDLFDTDELVINTGTGRITLNDGLVNNRIDFSGAFNSFPTYRSSGDDILLIDDTSIFGHGQALIAEVRYRNIYLS